MSKLKTLPQFKTEAEERRFWKPKIDDALKWARKQPKLIEDDYYDGYYALRNLFEKLDIESELKVMAAAYAVYGWMPTILRKGTDAKELAAFVRDLRKIANGPDQNKLTLRQLENRIDIMMAVNESTVGTSKFLHFTAPEIFPIWDSNVARAFGFTTRHQINNPNIYLQYCEALHFHLDRERIEWPTEIRNLGQERSEYISNVRKLELCLYAYGKHRKSRP